jgi:selenocysteine-specific elongation factor
LAERLEALERADPGLRLSALAGLVTSLGLTPQEAAAGVGLEAQAAVTVAGVADDLVVLPSMSDPTLIVRRDRYEAYLDDLVDRTRAFHRDNPSLAGIELERLRTGARGELDARLFREIVDGLVARGRLVRGGNTAALPDHRISMCEADEQLASRVLRAIRDAGTTPPSFKQVEEAFGIPVKRMTELVTVLVERGEVVKVAPDLAYDRAVMADIEGRLRAHLEREREITAAGFRDLISASRKYSIPLLDYFDRSGVTIRSGDYRKLRSG